MRALIADASGIVRLGLAEILSRASDSVETHEASDFETAIEEVRRNSGLDLVLFDAQIPNLPRNEPLTAVDLIRGLQPNARLIVVSEFESRRQVLQFLERGVNGCIHKDVDAEEAVRAVRRVLDGEVWLPRHFFQQGRDVAATEGNFPATELSGPRGWERLSERQRQILSLLASGKTNPEIASIVGLSKYTVRHHVSIILRTLNVSNRAEAMVLAREFMRTKYTKGLENI